MFDFICRNLHTARMGFVQVAVLLLLAATTGCNPDTTNVSPNIKELGALEGAILIDTFSIDGSTYLYDSTLASEAGLVPVGNYADDQVGKTRAVGYFDFALPSVSDSFPAATVFDSLVFSLPYTWQHTDAVPKTIMVELHRLRAPIPKDSIFFANSYRDYDPTVIAEDTFIITNTATRSGYLTFTLTTTNTTLGTELVEFGKHKRFGTGYADNVAFSKQFYGFALVPKTQDNLLANINLATASMVMYYRTAPATTPLSTAFTLYGSNRFYSSFACDRAGTPTAGLTSTSKILPASQSNGRVYVQNMASLWAKIGFPGYIPFRKKHPELTLVQAVLELNADPTPTYAYQGPLPRLIPWQGSADHFSLGRNGNFNKGLANGTSTDYSVPTSFLAYYDTVSTRYQIDVTSYLLAVEDGTVYNSGMLLSAPVGVPYLAPFAFSLPQYGSAKKSRLKAYFVRLDR